MGSIFMRKCLLFSFMKMELVSDRSSKIVNECTITVQPEEGKPTKIEVLPLAKLAADSWDPDELCVRSLTFVLRASGGTKSCPSSKVVFCGTYELAERKYEEMTRVDPVDDTTWTFDGGVFHTTTVKDGAKQVQYFSSPSLNGQLCTLRLIVDHRVFVKDACVLIESDGVVANVTMDAGTHKEVKVISTPAADGGRARKKRRGGT